MNRLKILYYVILFYFMCIKSNMLSRRFRLCSSHVKRTPVLVFLPRCACEKRSTESLRVQYNKAFHMMFGLPRLCSASSAFAERVPRRAAVIRTRVAGMMERIYNFRNAHMEFPQASGSSIEAHWRKMFALTIFYPMDQ